MIDWIFTGFVIVFVYFVIWIGLLKPALQEVGLIKDDIVERRTVE